MNTDNFKPSAVIEPCLDKPGWVTVWTEWAAIDGTKIDRPRTSGISLTKSLAARLKACIEAGKAYGPAVLMRDVNGATFVSAGLKILGRHANADLKRLGF
jgi:hypothetical protein